MPKFKQLIQIEGVKNERRQARHTNSTPRKASGRTSGGRGCGSCPLDKVKGINKIFGRVRGRDIFIWAQSPGATENKEGRELLGKAGEWWWKECAAAGIKREECDIQNVVRCFPATYDSSVWPSLTMRNPSKEEIHCCSVYNDDALAKSKAKVHIILGQIAGKELLGQEYRKDKRIFWSKKLKGKVICLDHPAYFLRGAPRDRLVQFRRDLKYAASVVNTGGGKYGYIKSQNYKGVTSIREARNAYRKILELANKGCRISTDLEEGNVDDQGRPTEDNSGTPIPLVMGFCGKVGESYVFPLEHPDAPVNKRTRLYCRKLVRKLLNNPAVRKVLQHGSYDVSGTRKLLSIRFRGYDFDTNYAEFLAYPDRHSFALDAIAAARFPEFVGYKEIVVPESFTSQAKREFKKRRMKKAGLSKKYLLARKTLRNGLNLALLPWKKMVLYNGADNDLQKRIEVSTKKKVSLPLLHVYQDAQFVLNRMEKLPPLFDYEHYDKLVEHYPVSEKWLRKRLIKISGKKDFNPNSPVQVSKVIYEKLHLPVLGDKPDTTKETMAALASYHKFPSLVTEYRRVAKICSTYLAGFKASADQNHGRVRTIWWLTGTRTGRLSSGGGDSGEEGVVNLQNIHGDPLLQCLLVSDLRWKQLYSYWKEHGDFTEKSWKRFENYEIFLGFDHSQMELRCVAQKSGDKNLIKAFHAGADIHAQVGHELTGWSVKKVTENEAFRRLIKNMHFGIVFGLNENNLANYMRRKGVKDVDDNEVKKFYRAYFKKYSGVGDMIESDREFVKENGYVETLFGFRRYLNTGASDGGAYWGNQAVNTPIQGTAHQLMLMGLVPLHRKPKTYKILKYPQLEIHDAIYFVVKLKDLFKAAIKGQYMLEKEALNIVKKDFNIDWKVPLRAEPKAAIRFGVQVKLPGIKTEWEFLNQWCRKNKELQIRMQKEHRELLEKVQ